LLLPLAKLLLPLQLLLLLWWWLCLFIAQDLLQLKKKYNKKTLVRQFLLFTFSLPLLVAFSWLD